MSCRTIVVHVARSLAFLWAGLFAASLFSAEPARPNILLIMSDDMGYSDLGCYGGEIETPTLNRLAAGGLRFTQFYNTARCCPTRACLLTGLYPHQAGMGHMTHDAGLAGYRGDLASNAVTIAEVLGSAGYRTYMTGKWHVCRDVAPDGPKYNWPLARGFEKFYGTITGAGSYYDPTTLCRGDTYVTPRNDPEYQPDTFYYTDAISDNAVRFLAQHYQESPEQPFFLYVAFTAAHWPMHALPNDIEKYQGRYDAGYAAIRAARMERLRALGLIEPDWELTPGAEDWNAVPDKRWESRNMEVYAAMVDAMDRGIGRIVASLEQRGALDNTLILFLQDNGGCAEPIGRRDLAAWHLEPREPMGRDELQPRIVPPMYARDGRAVRGGPQTMAGAADTYIAYGRGWANVSNTPFREYKHWVHEGGISTPLIAHWPARVRRTGELARQPAHLIDLMATCVDAAGADYPTEHAGHAIQPMEGVSLVPVFAGEPLHRAQPIFWEHEGNRAVRDGRWKLVAKGPNGPWELYDLESDRTEMHDLAAAEPERVAALAKAWEAWAVRASAKPWPWDRAQKGR